MLTDRIKNHGMPAPVSGHNRFYAVIAPQGINNSLSQFAGQHQSFTVDGVTGYYAWVDNTGSLTGHNSTTKVFSHELNEACTNPDVDTSNNGILVDGTGVNNDEIGDTCNNQFATVDMNGVQCSVQAYWSKADNICILPLGTVQFWVDKSTFGKDEVQDVISTTGGKFEKAFWLVVEGFSKTTFGTLNVTVPVPTGPFASLPGVTIAQNPDIDFENGVDPERAAAHPHRVRHHVPRFVARLVSRVRQPDVRAEWVLRYQRQQGAGERHVDDLRVGRRCRSVLHEHRPDAGQRLLPESGSARVHGDPGAEFASGSGRAGIHDRQSQRRVRLHPGPAGLAQQQFQQPGRRRSVQHRASEPGQRAAGRFLGHTVHDRHQPFSGDQFLQQLQFRRRARPHARIVGSRRQGVECPRVLPHVDDAVPGHRLPDVIDVSEQQRCGGSPGVAAGGSRPHHAAVLRHRQSRQQCGLLSRRREQPRHRDPVGSRHASGCTTAASSTYTIRATSSTASRCRHGSTARTTASSRRSPSMGRRFQPDRIREASDKLAQRNLQVTHSDNPGPAATHRIPQTFDIRPSAVAALQTQVDELMIDWGRIPHGSTASLYWPQVQASDVLALASRLYPSHSLTSTDAHTIACKVSGGVTYVPIPMSAGENFAGLFTVDLPTTVVTGQEFNVVVRRIGRRSNTEPKPVGREQAGSEEPSWPRRS